MALQIASELTPAGGGTFYLLEDVYIKGGLQVRPTVADRDLIALSNLKLGQLVLTIEDSKIWKVKTLTLQTRDTPDVVESVEWEELKLGGGDDAPSDGQIYGRKDGMWTVLGGQLNTRMAAIHTIENLPADTFSEFELELAVSCIVLNLSVDRPCQVTAYGTAIKDESNPYQFVATDDHLIDDGTMLLADGTKFRSRNFSIFSNMEVPASNKIYFTVSSTTEAEGPVALTIRYLPLELIDPDAEIPDPVDPVDPTTPTPTP